MVHDQLSLVYPSLSCYLPQSLPIEPCGLWAYFVHVEAPDESICDDIRQYLSTAVDVCGETLVINMLFDGDE